MTTEPLLQLALGVRDLKNRAAAKKLSLTFVQENVSTLGDLQRFAQDKHNDVDMRARACWLLSLVDSKSSCGRLLIGLLQDENDLMMAEAAKLLGDIGYRPSVRALLNCLEYPSPFRRRMAAHALGFLYENSTARANSEFS